MKNFVENVKSFIDSAIEELVYLPDTIREAKKFYLVDVKSKGKYNAVLGKRLFISKLKALEFYVTCLQEWECEVTFEQLHLFD
jgi:hypothetical protein